MRLPHRWARSRRNRPSSSASAHATQAQIKALHEEAMTRFSAILTPAQKTKLDQMHQMHHPDGAPEDAPPAD